MNFAIQDLLLIWEEKHGQLSHSHRESFIQNTYANKILDRLNNGDWDNEKVINTIAVHKKLEKAYQVLTMIGPGCIRVIEKLTFL